MLLTEVVPLLPTSVARHAVDTLVAIIPPPVPDTPEARNAREQAAIAAFVALRPADAFEAMLGVQIVAVSAHADECFRLAALPGLSLQDALRSRAQAAALLRTMRGGLRDLQSHRALREARAARARRVAHQFDGSHAMQRSGDRYPTDPATAPTGRTLLH